MTTPAPASEPRALRDRAAIAVIAVWAAMTALVFAYIWKYGRNIPYMEDWELVPALTDHSPFGFDWLATQTIEHRYILAKAVLYPLWQLTYDARSSMYASAILLSAITLALVIAVRNLRGAASYADVFFPLALLHPGHCETLIFFIQICYVLPVAIFVVALLLIATCAWERSAVAATALALCVMLLPANGAIGMLLAPALVAWMLWVYSRKRAPIVFPVAAAITLIATGWYFVGYTRPSTFVPLERSVRGTFRTLVELCSVALGPGGAWWWPWMGLAVGGVLVAAAAGLALEAWRQADDRPRAAGLLACLVASGLLVAGIAWGRTTIGPGAGIPPRYALLVVLGLCVAFLSLTIFARTGVASRVIQAGFAVVAAGLLWPNIDIAREYGRPRAEKADVVCERLAAGTPSSVVAARYYDGLYPDPNVLAARLELLRAQGSGPFLGMANTGTARPCELDPDAPQFAGLENATLVDGWIECRTDDGGTLWSLASPREVCTVRVVYEFRPAAANEPAMQLYWSVDGVNGFEESRRNQTIAVDATPGEHAVQFDVYDRLDRLRIDPDRRPCTVRIVRVEVTSRDGADQYRER